MDESIIVNDWSNIDVGSINDDHPLLFSLRTAPDKLLFDGYNLKWISGSNETNFVAFSGQADESKKESAIDLGPIPQGEYAIDPKNIQTDPENWPGGEDAWGKTRVKIEPLKVTLDRMKICFGSERSGMYVHGGTSLGTIGCIEVNDKKENEIFFTKLKSYNKKIQLIVKYTGERKTKFEEPKCPYN